MPRRLDPAVRDLRNLPAAAAEAAALLRLLGNDQRLLILCHLAEQELSVGALQQRMELSQSALSQHLARLREMDLVRTRREGQAIHYSLAEGPVRPLMATLHSLFCPD